MHDKKIGFVIHCICIFRLKRKHKIKIKEKRSARYVVGVACYF